MSQGGGITLRVLGKQPTVSCKGAGQGASANTGQRVIACRGARGQPVSGAANGSSASGDLVKERTSVHRG